VIFSKPAPREPPASVAAWHTVICMAKGPLSGVRVVEMAGQGPAPFAAMVMADLGASVIRLDRPGDVPSPLPSEHSRELLARGKRSVAIDLKADGGRDLALQLIDGADILFDPFRPGVMERLGLGPDELLERFPGLVYGRMTGWGQDGPEARTAGHDINYVSLAGALYDVGPAGGVPTVPINLVGDFGGGGMLLVVGVLSALIERGVSGKGQVVDAAMLDGSALLMTSIWQLDALGYWPRERATHFLTGYAPWYGAYATSDRRYVSFGAIEPQFYAELLDRLGLDPAAWPQFEIESWPAQREEIAAMIGSRSQAEWVEVFAGSDACFAPVLDMRQAAAHPHNRERGTFVELDGITQPAPAPRFSRTPGEVARPPCWPGEHTEEILAELAAAD
jgi:alpha-methylacyl-CoA racemase